VDLDSWWQEQKGLGFVQQFICFLHDVLLEEIEGPIVIFIDEIDSTLVLPFSDDFFAAIRSIYKARVNDKTYQRLTFVLSGVATPTDLIRDRSRTPFNISQGIELSDFSRESLGIYQQGLNIVYPKQGATILNRIFYWTSGHPYLTQKLCLNIIETGSGSWTDEQIDELVTQIFLSEKGRRETNLQFVRDSIMSNSYKRQLLNLYRQVYTGKIVREDDHSLNQEQLKLFGLVRVENGVLKVRNEIYRRVFNMEWINANTPPIYQKRWIALAALIPVLILVLYLIIRILYA
jgi:hypothetical protein